MPEHLERRAVVHDLTEAEKLCPCCGRPRVCIGVQAAEQLDLEPARFGRQADPAGGLADYFYGRCLAEAGVQLDEALACLQRAALAETGNPAVIHSLALALARSEIFSNRAAASEIWNKEGLPARYHNKSELTADVSSQQSTFDFDLKAK